MSLIRDIQHQVAARYGLTREDLLRHCRLRTVVRARHEAMWLAWLATRRPKSIIAREFRRDRTTVLAVLQKMERGATP